MFCRREIDQNETANKPIKCGEPFSIPCRGNHSKSNIVKHGAIYNEIKTIKTYSVGKQHGDFF